MLKTQKNLKDSKKNPKLKIIKVDALQKILKIKN